MTDEANDFLENFFKELAEGKCPYCHKDITMKQDGRCVYGSCGHRLFQGELEND